MVEAGKQTIRTDDANLIRMTCGFACFRNNHSLKYWQ